MGYCSVLTVWSFQGCGWRLHSWSWSRLSVLRHAALVTNYIVDHICGEYRYKAMIPLGVHTCDLQADQFDWVVGQQVCKRERERRTGKKKADQR